MRVCVVSERLTCYSRLMGTLFVRILVIWFQRPFPLSKRDRVELLGQCRKHPRRGRPRVLVFFLNWHAQILTSYEAVLMESRKSPVYMYIYICIFRQHFFVNTNFIKHNRHFLSTYFLLDPFVIPYCFYRIRRELIYVASIVVCIPSTFCPTLGHHQERIYYKRDVTFVLAYYYYVRASLPL